MPESDVWPPKPSILDPLMEYDGLIAAKLAALPEPRRSRLLLMKALRDEEQMQSWVWRITTPLFPRSAGIN